MPVDKVAACEADFHKLMEANHEQIGKSIAETKEIVPEIEEGLKTAVQEFKQGFSV